MSLVALDLEMWRSAERAPPVSEVDGGETRCCLRPVPPQDGRLHAHLLVTEPCRPVCITAGEARICPEGLDFQGV